MRKVTSHVIDRPGQTQIQAVEEALQAELNAGFFPLKSIPVGPATFVVWDKSEEETTKPAPKAK